MGNVTARVGNYVTLKRSEVGNCVTADTVLLKALGRLGSVCGRLQASDRILCRDALAAAERSGAALIEVLELIRQGAGS